MTIPEALKRANAIDLSRMITDIEKSYYSNLSYINISGRDIYIDFLEMPGVIRDGVPVVKGIRVFMPFTAALRMIEVIATLMEKAEKSGSLAPLHPTNPSAPESPGT